MSIHPYAKIYNELSQPFDLEAIQWKPGATTKDKSRALALPYVESRQYIRRLNQAAGADWQDRYEVIVAGERLIVVCCLVVAGVGRTGDGECALDDPNAMTSASAQAFKRACVKHGLGAYLYDVPKIWADYDRAKRRFTDAALRDLAAHVRGSGGDGGGPAGHRDAGAIRVRFGKHRGKTLRQIVETAPAYLEWLAQNWQWAAGREAAAAVLAEHRLPAKPAPEIEPRERD